MTPEGLNSRLTFLQQCLRPGETIPTVTKQGTQIVDADNTAFGPPPICVLRIGDFYHSKIFFDSISFSYDPLLLDMNPEGIGAQPWLVRVSMQMFIVGGMSLEGPLSQLQNATSFNYFANTEIFLLSISQSSLNVGVFPTNFCNFSIFSGIFSRLVLLTVSPQIVSSKFNYLFSRIFTVSILFN